MVLGAGFDNWLRDLVQTTCPIGLAVLGVGAVLRSPWIEPLVPLSIAAWYPLFVIIIGATYGRYVHQTLFTASAVITLTSWVLDSGVQAYQQLRRTITGLDELSAGIMLFIVALAISLQKAGLGPRLRIRALSDRLLGANRAVAVESCWEADDPEGGGPTISDSATDGDDGADLRQ